MVKQLTVKDTIEQVIQGEIKELVAYKGAPYIKFQLIVTAIEFLGACLDSHDFAKQDESEERFNKALKLFPKKYHKYAKKDSTINLYRDLRCGMIHKLRPLSPKIRLTERRHIGNNNGIHMNEINGLLPVVLEDFYNDLDRACNEVKRKYKNNKLPKKSKIEQNYIEVSSLPFGDNTLSVQPNLLNINEAD